MATPPQIMQDDLATIDALKNRVQATLAASGPNIDIFANNAGVLVGKLITHREFGDEGYTVNTVALGATESEMLGDVPKGIVNAQLEITAVGHRVIKVDGIAKVAAWSVNEDANWMSGLTTSASGWGLML